MIKIDKDEAYAYAILALNELIDDGHISAKESKTIALRRIEGIMHSLIEHRNIINPIEQADRLMRR